LDYRLARIVTNSANLKQPQKEKKAHRHFLFRRTRTFIIVSNRRAGAKEKSAVAGPCQADMRRGRSARRQRFSSFWPGEGYSLCALTNSRSKSPQSPNVGRTGIANAVARR
jgi:hypothetical protein